MKLRNYLIIITILATMVYTQAYGQPKVNYSDKVIRFIEDHHKIGHHRSGVIDAEESTLLEVIREKSKPWKSGDFFEYEGVVDLQTVSDIQDGVKASKSAHSYHSKIDDTRGVLRIERSLNENDRMKKYKLNQISPFVDYDILLKRDNPLPNEYIDQKMIKKVTSQYLREISFKYIAELEINSLYTNYVKNEFGDKDIVTIGVRYRRLFEGGLIRGNLSYVDIIIDAETGEVNEAEIKWMNFVKKKKSKKAIEDPKSSLEKLQFAIDALPEAFVLEEGDNIKHHVEKIDVNGVARAWKLSEAEDEKISITPVYSYLLDIGYGNGARTIQIIDVPILEGARID